MSLKQKIYDYVKSQDRVVHKGEIIKVAILNWDCEGDTAGRRCRELEEAGMFERTTDAKGRAMYKIKGGNDALQKLREIRQREEAKNPPKPRQATLL